MLGLAAAEGPCTFEQAGERGHRVSVEWDGPMAGCGLAAANGGDASEEVHVLSAKILDFHTATRSRNREQRCAMRYQPFRTARRGLK